MGRRLVVVVVVLPLASHSRKFFADAFRSGSVHEVIDDRVGEGRSGDVLRVERLGASFQLLVVEGSQSGSFSPYANPIVYHTLDARFEAQLAAVSAARYTWVGTELGAVMTI